MRWIILTRDRPAQLHALLASAAAHMPHVVPDIVVPASDDFAVCAAHEMVARRFPKAAWYVVERDTMIHETVASLAEMPTRRAGDQTIAMLTTDTMAFRCRVVLRDAWAAFRDPNTIALSLTLDEPKVGGNTLTGRVTIGDGRPPLRTWLWPSMTGPFRQAFHYGAIYRTGDLVGPLMRNTQDHQEPLQTAVSGDPAWLRRTRMACLERAVIVERDLPILDGVRRYLAGEVIDIDALVQDGADRYNWVKYAGE